MLIASRVGGVDSRYVGLGCPSPFLPTFRSPESAESPVSGSGRGGTSLRATRMIIYYSSPASIDRLRSIDMRRRQDARTAIHQGRKTQTQSVKASSGGKASRLIRACSIVRSATGILSLCNGYPCHGKMTHKKRRYQ